MHDTPTFTAIYSEVLEIRSRCDDIYSWVTVVNYC